MLVVHLKAVWAGVQVIGYFKFFLDSVFELLYMAGLFVSFGEVIDVPFLEGDDETTYHGAEHVCCEPCKAVSHDLSRSQGEGSGWHLSHNGQVLLCSNGEGWGGGTGRSLIRQFDRHG